MDGYNDIEMPYFVELNSKVNYHVGKLPGLVVNIEDSQSEPWPLDVGSNPGFTKKLHEKMDHLMAEKLIKNKDSQKGKPHQKKY